MNQRMSFYRLAAFVWLAGLMGGAALAQSESPQTRDETPSPARRSIAEPPAQSGYTGSGSELQAGQWKGGGGIGFLGSTPDGGAVAMNGNLDYFMSENASVGPLLQVGISDDASQLGLSGQGKYWVSLPGTEGRGKLSVQSGVGFVHSDFRGGDTSWLVPLGVGYDYTPGLGPSLTATALVNLTNLDTGSGSGADVMPGFVFGVRF